MQKASGYRQRKAGNHRDEEDFIHQLQTASFRFSLFLIVVISNYFITVIKSLPAACFVFLENYGYHKNINR